MSDKSERLKELGGTVPGTDELRPAAKQWLSSITAVETWIERHSIILLCVFSLACFGIVGWIASRRLFWLDELYTFYVSRLPSVGAIATALLNDAEQHPPLDFILRHWSQVLFGTNEFGTRFPSILGFSIAGVSVFWFVKRRADSILAFIAMFALFATNAFRYAFEARAYGPILGFSAVALLSWQSLAMGRPRRALWAFALFAGLATCISVHYYGIFIYLPLTAGELMRTIMRRKIDWLVVAAMAVAAAAELLNLPYMIAARSFSLGRTAGVWELLNLYAALFADTVYVLVMLLAVMGLLQFISATSGRGNKPPHDRFPVHERVAVLSILLLPVVCFLLAQFTKSGLYPRYALATVLGACMLTAMVADAITAAYPPFRLSLFACLAVFAAFQMVLAVANYRGEQLLDKHVVLTAVQHTSLPLVCADPHRFFPWNYYLPEVRGRVYFVADVTKSIEWSGRDSRDRLVLGLKDFIPGQVASYDTFIRDNPRFIVLEEGQWLMSQLFADDATVTLRQLPGRVTVYEVAMKR
jgi:hypothetical protein